jgi:CRP/FNR family transcriptional regulator, anaerobic regulatory protein
MGASDNWLDRFPELSGLPEDIRAVLRADARVAALPEGVRVFGPGQAPGSFLLLLSGVVRVQQVAENGREIVLYRVSAGESCPLTTACLMGHDTYTADGVTETAVEAVMIPRAAFDDLIGRSPVFRRFVFAAFSGRIAGLFRVIEDIAFQRLDIRLAQKLLELADAQGEVHATHQQLATEIGSAREVISRQLQEFARRGWVKSGRGVIVLTDGEAVRTLANFK